MKNKHIKGIKECEKQFLKIFCISFNFSKNLIKYVDSSNYDMYDHNHFENNKYTTLKEIEEAYSYQSKNNFDYLKIISNYRLKDNIINRFKLKENIVLTMLYDNSTDNFKINDKVTIKRITKKDLNHIELKHYEKSCGRRFIIKRTNAYINPTKTNNNFIYYGAYINNKIVGACHSFTNGDYTCLDSLVVDNRHRHKHIATTMIKYIKDRSKYLYLHANIDEKPVELYRYLGFKEVLKTYDYFLKVK